MAHQLRTFNMSRMTLGACADFHVTVEKHITLTTPEILHVEDKIEAYREKVKLLESIINRKRSYRTTPKMRAGDKTRDGAIGSVNGVVNVMRTSPIEEKRLAAELLYQELSPYRGIGRHELHKQTSEVRGMLDLLDSEENKAAIQVLGLTQEVELLRTTNEELSEMYDERYLEVSDVLKQSDIDSDELKREVNTMYGDIAQVINAYAIVQPSDEINSFIDIINGLIGSMAAISGGSSSADDPDDGSEPVTPDEGYRLDSLTVNGKDYAAYGGVQTQYEGEKVTVTFPSWIADKAEIAAVFDKIDYIVPSGTTAENGTVTVSDRIPVGDDLVISLAPDDGYIFSSLTIKT